MLPLLLLLIPLVGIFIISSRIIYIGSNSNEVNYIALITLVVNLLVSLVM